MKNLVAYVEVFAVAIGFRYSAGQDIVLDYKMLFLLLKHFLGWMSAETRIFKAYYFPAPSTLEKIVGVEAEWTGIG